MTKTSDAIGQPAPDLTGLVIVLRQAAEQLARLDSEVPDDPQDAPEAVLVVEATRQRDEAKERLDQLIAEQQQLEARYKNATESTSADELRETAERLDALRFDTWEARVSLTKLLITRCDAARDLTRSRHDETLPAWQILSALYEDVAKARRVFSAWRSAREARIAGASFAQERGRLRLELDALLAAPPTRR